MANAEHVARLKHSLFAEEWNEWRQENPDIRPDLVEASLGEEDLSCADLRGADLRGASLKAARLSNADLSSADLSEANLSDAYFSGATLTGCDLKEADLSGANLFGVNLSEARLCGASLEYANLSRADFRGADLSNANLRETKAVETNFANANLTGCRVYGISAWGLKLEGATQQDLIITPDGEPEITVDNIEVAQFIYLLLHNEKIRDVIDTITSKARADPRSLHTRAQSRPRCPTRGIAQARLPADPVRLRRASDAGHHRDRLAAGPHGPLHHRRPDRSEQHPEGAGGDRASPGSARSVAAPRTCSTLCYVQGSFEVRLDASTVPIRRP